MVIGVGVSTCRIGDLLTVPQGGLLYTIPGPDQGADSVLAGSAEFGSTANHVMKIYVGHTGKGLLDWSATIGGASPWLTITNKTGSSGDSISVVGNPIGLDTGTHRDSIIVTSNAGGTIVVPVRFDIDTCTVTSLQSSGDEKVDSLKTSNCGAPHHSGTQARLFSFTANSGELATVLLSASFNGYLALDTSATGAPLLTATDCQGDTKNPCIYYFHLPRTTTYIIEVTGATPADIGEFKVRLLRTSRNPNAPDSLDQRRVKDSSSVGVGDTVRSTTVLFRAVVSDSDAVDALHLEAEAQPINTNFTGAPTAIGQPVVNGQPAWVSQSVITGVSYHWCVKVVDQTGSGSACLPFGGNADSPLPAATDFVVKTGNDPNPPTNLKQLQSDGSTVIPTGQTTNGTTVVFQGDISDPDPGNTVQLQVEVQPIDSAFTNQLFAPSAPVPNPSTGVQVTVNAPKLVDGKSYHWQARTVDNTGLPSAWVSFGGNADSPLPAAADFNVQVLPTKLVITVQPAVDTSGRPIHPNVQVTAQDQNNNTVTSFNGAVTMAITPGTGTLGAALSGTNPVPASLGVATFTDLSINKSGSGYKLQASAVIGGNTITSAPSTTFNVLPGPGAKLAFTTQPTNTVAGQTIPPVVVAVQDTAGNTDTSYSGSVTVGITAGTGKFGAALIGTKTVAVANGLATFSTLSIDSAATGYTLTATSTGLASATSAAFAINPGPATRLQFTGQPHDAASGGFLTPPVQVTAFDVKGNVATGFTSNITVAITTGTGKAGAALSGTKVKAAVAGVANYSDLSVDSAAAGYTLTATATGLTSATSTAFTISPSQISPTLSMVSVNPATITASNGSSATTITVTAKDGTGNPVSGATVVFSATPATGNTLTPASATTNGSGVATATLSSTKAEVKTVSVTINSVSINQTPTVTVNPGTPTALDFTAGPPTNTTAGAAINSGTGGVVVTARDQFGNTATSFNATLNMTIAAGPGGVFAPTSVNSATAVSGVAQFLGLRIYTAGSGYQIQAAGGGLNVTSGSFSINAAPPFQLAFTTPPQNTAVLAKIDSAIGGVVVKVQDSVGNTTPFGGTVRVIVGNPGTNPGGGTLANGSAIPAPSGIATFQNLTLDKLGTGYTLQTTSSGPVLQPDESTPFNIIPGPATTLTFTTQPTDAVAGALIDSAAGGVKVTALDAHGFVATSFTGNVTVAIGTNPSGGTLSGTKVVPAALGVATFTTLRINNVGTGYTLTASATGLSNGTSQSFNILQGGVSASQSTVLANPTTITACKTGCSAGAGTASTITVTAKDAQGNGIAGATVTLASTSTSANITQPSGVTNSAGQISGMVSDTTTGSQTITATVTLSPNAPVQVTQTATVSVNAAAPAAAQFLRNPTTTTAGAIITPATGVQVQIVDQFGNRTNATSSVLLSILVPPSPGGATLFGQNPKNAFNGVATFTDLHIDKTGVGYQLLAASTGLVSDSSTKFDITSGTVSASQSTVIAAPTTINACSSSCSTGAGTATQITVTAKDGLGNGVPNASVTLTISGSGNTTAPVSLTQTANASGVATWTLNSIVPESKVISATANGVSITQTQTVTVTSTGVSASQSAVSASPATIAACQTSCSTGAGTATTITVTAKDQFGNGVGGASVTIAISGTGGNTTSPASLTQTANGSGVATWQLNSTIAESKTVTATANAVAITDNAVVTVNPGTVAAAQSTVSANPTSITACAASCSPGAGTASTITVTATDQFGNTVGSASVTIAITGSLNTTSPVSLTQTANGSGVATWTLNSSFPETKTISATANSVSITETATVTVNTTVVSASQSTVSASPATIAACQTSCTPGGGTATTITVTAKDQFGNGVGGASVTIAISGAGGNTTSPVSLTQTANGSGIATWQLNSTVAESKTVTATANAVAITDNAAVTVNPGAVSASQSTVTTPQTTDSACSGTCTTATNRASLITITAKDQFQNLIQNATVVMSGSPATGNTFTAPPNTNSSGVSTSTFSSTKAESKTISATVGGVLVTQTVAVTVIPAGVNAANSSLTAGLSSITACATSCTQGAGTGSVITVTAKDAFGNLIQNAKVVLSSTGSNPAFNPSPPNTNSSGVSTSTFSSTTAEGKTISGTLQVGSGSIVGITQTAGVTVTAGSATQLAFTNQPTTTTAGAIIDGGSGGVMVAQEDQFGNIVTSTRPFITVAIGTNPGSTSLGGNNLTVRAAPGTGTSTFSDLFINVAAAGYTLQATSAGLATATSGSFDITPAAADHLAFTVQPSDAVNGNAITPAVEVTVFDQFGNIANFNGTVTLTVVGGGSGITGNSVSAQAGVATYSNLILDTPGTYNLNADGGGLPTVQSGSFTIS